MTRSQEATRSFQGRVAREWSTCFSAVGEGKGRERGLTARATAHQLLYDHIRGDPVTDFILEAGNVKRRVMRRQGTLFIITVDIALTINMTSLSPQILLFNMCSIKRLQYFKHYQQN
jgi:hypothetical protein